jgi:hypothetical protein
MSPRAQSGYDPVGDPRTGRPPLADERQHFGDSADESASESRIQAIRSTAGELVGEGAATLRSVGETLSRQASAAVERGSALAATTSEHVQSYSSELVAFARRRPLGALAGALVLGLLIGLLRRTRS